MRHLIFRGRMLTLLVAVALVALAAWPATALELKSLNLGLVSPDPGNNINYTTIYVTASGTIDDDDNATTSISGTLMADLGITSFNALTGAIPELANGSPNISQVEFTGGNFSLTDMSMELGNWLITAYINATGLGGTVDTPPAGPGVPAATTGYSSGVATFNSQDHEVVLNQGNFKVTAAGQEVYDLNLANEPMSATTEGVGTFAVSLNGVSGHVATYNVTMDLPLVIAESFYVEQEVSLITVKEDITVDAEATVRATAQFTQTLPTLAGDLNTDGFVGGDDLDIVRSYWGQYVAPGAMAQGDPSGDGFVGGDDLDIVRAQWGMGTLPPPPLAAVPEPSTWASLIGLAFSSWVCTRRRLEGTHV